MPVAIPDAIDAERIEFFGNGLVGGNDGGAGGLRVVAVRGIIDRSSEPLEALELRLRDLISCTHEAVSHFRWSPKTGVRHDDGVLQRDLDGDGASAFHVGCDKSLAGLFRRAEVHPEVARIGHIELVERLPRAVEHEHIAGCGGLLPEAEVFRFGDVAPLAVAGEGRHQPSRPSLGRIKGRVY